MVEDQEGLQETRKQLLRNTLKHEQEARDREVKSRQIARIDALAKETAATELTSKKAKEALAKEQAIKRSRQAEEARRAEAEKKAKSDRLSWGEVSPNGLPPKKRAGSYHWPRAVGMRLVSRDEILTSGIGYR